MYEEIPSRLRQVLVNALQTSTTDGHRFPSRLRCQLRRNLHVASADCKCPARSRLHHQAQAQPKHLSHRVTCATYGVHVDNGASLSIVALSSNCLLVRLSKPDSKLLSGILASAEAGDYLYELPVPPASAARQQAQHRSSWVGARPFAWDDNVRIAAMHISFESERVLCVLKEGYAYSLKLPDILRTSSRVLDAELADGAVYWRSPSGPSLYQLATDPRFQLTSKQVSQPKAIPLGTLSEGDFEPLCCVWWRTLREKSHLTLIGGTAAGRPTLSVVDMDEEREVEFLQLPEDLGTGSEIENLSIESTATRRDETTCQVSEGPQHQVRRLYVSLTDGKLFWILLESQNEPPRHPSPLADRTRSVSATPTSTPPRQVSRPPTPRRNTYESPTSSSGTALPSRDLSPPRSVTSLLLTPPRWEKRSRGRRKREAQQARDREKDGGQDIKVEAKEGQQKQEEMSLWEWSVSDQRLVGGVPGHSRSAKLIWHDCSGSVNESEATKQSAFSSKTHTQHRIEPSYSRIHWLALSPPRYISSPPCILSGQLCPSPVASQPDFLLSSRPLAPEKPNKTSTLPPASLLAVIPLANDVLSLIPFDPLHLSKVLHVTSIGHVLLISVCCLQHRLIPSVATLHAVGVPTYWLLVYVWQTQAAEAEHTSEQVDCEQKAQGMRSRVQFEQFVDPKTTPQSTCNKLYSRPYLWRAFKSPSGSPFRPIGPVVLRPSTAEDLIELGQDDLFSTAPAGKSQEVQRNATSAKAHSSVSTDVSCQTSPSPSSMCQYDIGNWQVLVCHLWSCCSIFALHLLIDTSMLARSKPLTLGHDIIQLKTSPSDKLYPGALLAFLESLIELDRITEAVVAGWQILLPHTQPRIGFSVEVQLPEMLRQADPALLKTEGRAALALRLIECMANQLMFPRNNLAAFLERSQDYYLEAAVETMLGLGCITEALYAGWIRKGTVGIKQALEQLAKSPITKSLCLKPHVICWLCSIGAAHTLVSVQKSVLWIHLSLPLRLKVLLSDSNLLLMQPQYTWLQQTLPFMPIQCIRALTSHLLRRLALYPHSMVDSCETDSRHELSSESSIFESTDHTGDVFVRMAGTTGSLSPVFEAVTKQVTQQHVKADFRHGEMVITDDEDQDEDSSRNERGGGTNEYNRRLDSEVEQGACIVPLSEAGDVSRTRLLCELLLQAMLLLARPVAGSVSVLQSHLLSRQLMRINRNMHALESRPPSRDETMLPHRAAGDTEALQAQLVVEILVRLWSQGCILPPQRQFTASALLVMAERLRNPGCQALVLEAKDKIEAGLDIRLKEVREVDAVLEDEKIGTGSGLGLHDFTRGTQPSQQSDELSETTSDIYTIESTLLEYVYTHVLYVKSRDTWVLSWAQRRCMLVQVVQCWADLRLKADGLVRLCRRDSHGQEWSWHMLNALMTDIFVLDAGEDGSPVDIDGALGLLRFPCDFYVGLVDHVKRHGRGLHLWGITDMWSTGGMEAEGLDYPRSLADVYDAIRQHISGGDGQDDPTRPSNELTEGISETADHSRRPKRAEPAMSKRDLEVVAFSCCHVLTRNELLRRALPAMQKALNGLTNPLPVTAELLSQEYQESKPLPSLACPACVSLELAELEVAQRQGSVKLEDQHGTELASEGQG